jgi:type II secretion system protein N
MIQRIAFIIGGLLWCVLVFIGSLWLTFPSQAIVDRLAYQVQEASGGDYALRAASAGPWWAGLRLNDVRLIAEGGRGKPSSVLLDARSVRARTSPFSLLGGRVPIFAIVDVGGSAVQVDTVLDRSGGGTRLSSLKTTGACLSVNALGALLRSYGVGMSGVGDLSLDIDLSLGADVKEHDGRVAIKGQGMSATLALPDPFGGDAPFELGPITIPSLEVVLEARNGKVTIKTAELRSDYATLQLDGDLTLDSFLGRSRLRAKAVLSDLGGTLATFESFLSAARWDDGKYHYSLTCTLDRFGSSCFRPDRQRGAAASRAPSALRGAARAPISPPADSPKAEQLREERDRMRQQRLEDRRTRLDTSRPSRPEPVDGGEEEELEDDVEEYDEPTPRMRDRLVPARRGPEALAIPPDFDGMIEPSGEDWE